MKTTRWLILIALIFLGALIYQQSAWSNYLLETLAPPSGIKDSMSEELLKSLKLKELVEDGHDPVMAEHLLDIHMRIAQRSALRIYKGLDSASYLEEFSVSLARLQKSAEFFGVSLYEMARITGVPLEPSNLLYTARASWKLQRVNKEKDPFYEGLELGPQPTAETLDVFLELQLTFYRRDEFDLSDRLQRWINDPDKTRDQALDELVNVFEAFLYGENHAPAVYDYFFALQKHFKIPIEEITNSWRQTWSPRQRNIYEIIGQKGQMTYADYMKLVLYDPHHGYYMQKREKDFIGLEFETVPSLSPRFGEAVAVDLLSRWKDLGKPKKFDVIEMGAGQAHLAKAALNYMQEKSIADKTDDDYDPLWKDFYNAVQYCIVEISPSLIEKQKAELGDLAKKVTWREGSAVDLGKLFGPKSVRGVFLSNELPDAFPVHKVKKVNGRLKEVFVTMKNGVLQEEVGELSTDELMSHMRGRGINLAEGEEWLANLEAQRWMRSMAEALDRGAILTFDYGNNTDVNRYLLDGRPGMRSYGTRGFQQILRYMGMEVPPEQVHDRFNDEKSKGGDLFVEAQGMAVWSVNHPLSYAGLMDLTTEVDFAALAYEASRLGFFEESFEDQKQYMDFGLIRDEIRRKSIHPGVMLIAEAFSAQTLNRYDRQRQAEKPGLPPGPFDLILHKGSLDTPQNIRDFLDFLEEYNPSGLGSAASAIKENCARLNKPIAGISNDAFFFFAMKDNATPLFQNNRGFFDRDTFPISMPLREGILIDDFVSLLVRYSPIQALPSDFQEAAKDIRPIREGMSFREIFDISAKRTLIERAMAARAQAVFIVALDSLGDYEVDRYGLREKELETLIHRKWRNLYKQIAQAEPDKTVSRLEALLIAFELFNHRKKELIRVDVLPLIRGILYGDNFTISWPLLIKYADDVIEPMVPGINASILASEIIQKVPKRLLKQAQDALEGKLQKVPSDLSMILLDELVSVLDKKLPSLGPEHLRNIDSRIASGVLIDQML